MSVLLVTDDADDDIQNSSIINPQDYLYKQLKELEYDFSSSVISFSIVESSSSIIVKSNKHYRQHRRRRRRCRPQQQQCVVQHLLTYMLTLLILTNHLHWPVIFLSLSSIKIMSTHASTITTTTIVSSSNQIITIKRPILTPSISGTLLPEDEQQCLPIDATQIDRICSKTCRAQRTPFERKFDNINQILANTHYLPFCSKLLNQTVIQESFINETTENQCREKLKQLKFFDEEAQNASQSFATYMQAIDSASNENRYSIITSDCQKAYETWACSVRIPYYYRNQRIPPCQSICDEVERVCPTFRPSDREPLFAGQPLFFCNGGIVSNRDYGRRPHCFDTCHLYGSLQRPSVLSSNTSSSSILHPISKFVEKIVTTPTCFEIKPLSPSSSDQITSSLIFVDGSISTNTSNTSLSASAITIISSSWSSIILTFIFVFQWKFLQE